MKPLADEALTVKELAVILRMTEDAVWGHIRSGHIPSFRIGRWIRVRRSALEQLMGCDPADRLVEQAAGPEGEPLIIVVCAWCRRIRDDHGDWNSSLAPEGAMITHSICPECAARLEYPTAKAASSPTRSLKLTAHGNRGGYFWEPWGANTCYYGGGSQPVLMMVSDGYHMAEAVSGRSLLYPGGLSAPEAIADGVARRSMSPLANVPPTLTLRA
jgi:excisionase family DNA binding protein